METVNPFGTGAEVCAGVRSVFGEPAPATTPESRGKESAGCDPRHEPHAGPLPALLFSSGIGSVQGAGTFKTDDESKAEGRSQVVDAAGTTSSNAGAKSGTADAEAVARSDKAGAEAS